MTGHGTGIAEAEVEIAPAVHVGEPGAPAFRHEQGKATGPLHHPVHRHAIEQAGASALVQGPGFRVLLLEAALLCRVEGRQPGAVDHLRIPPS
jgi:hypothetical protein